MPFLSLTLLFKIGKGFRSKWSFLPQGMSQGSLRFSKVSVWLSYCSCSLPSRSCMLSQGSWRLSHGPRIYITVQDLSLLLKVVSSFLKEILTFIKVLPWFLWIFLWFLNKGHPTVPEGDPNKWRKFISPYRSPGGHLRKISPQILSWSLT